MESLPARYYQSITTLLSAYFNDQLHHDTNGHCVISHLLGGEGEWMDVINPTTGRIDHWTKYNQPRLFAKGLQLIQDSDYNVEEVIYLEALFAGRKRDVNNFFVSTLDEENDPNGSIGLSAVLEELEAMEYRKREAFIPQVSGAPV